MKKVVTLPPFMATYPQELLAAFVRFNREWIERYFRLEASDVSLLSDPVGHILQKGGYLFIALHDQTPAGCCALIPHADIESGKCSWELAKMAVTPSAQGLGIGHLLGNAVLEQARSLNVAQLFLEANTRLEASVHLYQKLGFVAIENYHAAYERCNLFMVCNLQNDTVSLSAAE